MLKLYDFADPTNVIPLPLRDSKRYVKHIYGGYDTLTFEIESNHPLYKYIAEEVKVEDEKNRYIIKLVDEHSTFVTISCDLDLDDWQEDIFRDFRMTYATLSDVLEEILPDGWTSTGDELFSKRATVEYADGEPFVAATAQEILDTAAEVYSCVYQFDTINKILTCIDATSFSTSGLFFTDELNLKSIGYTGQSTNFATRLYAYGKKDSDGIPLTFASINDGKEYVEDLTYSDKIISVGWSDERYTVASNLLEAAQEKLRKLSHPVRSYTCDACNLGSDIWLYKVVTLIDRRRRTRVEHQIVEYVEYPNHVADTIKLSSLEERIEGTITRIKNALGDDILDKKTTLDQIIRGAVANATDAIKGNYGGYFKWLYDGSGKPIELINLGDTDDIDTAQKVWRWNASGLGHSNNGYDGDYSMAFLADGSINASVITSGTMNANLIRAGRISDADGVNFWDLSTGEFRLVPTAVYVNGESTLQDTLDDIIDLVESGGVDLSQQAVFNALTNYGQAEGIFLTNGNLYLNATYMGTGTIADSDGINYWNLDTGEFRLIPSNVEIEEGKTLQDMLDQIEQEIEDVEVDLTQEEVFNALTNNGQWQGMFVRDGNIYFNATYIRGGTIAADYISGGELDCSQMTVSNLTFDNISGGTISADVISGGTINADNLDSLINLNLGNCVKAGTFLPATNLSTNNSHLSTLYVDYLSVGGASSADGLNMYANLYWPASGVMLNATGVKPSAGAEEVTWADICAGAAGNVAVFG